MADVHVIDIGVGNIGSIVNIITRIGHTAIVITEPQLLGDAQRAILPGVGAFSNAMDIIHSGGWEQALNDYVDSGRPILGICIGMQIMTQSSEEGQTQGLGWLNAKVIKFDLAQMNSPHRIPHMGWNIATVIKPNSIFDPTETEERFYFVHSYHVVCDEPEDVLTTTDYGYPFTSSFLKNNILGVQFHPEKSHRFGMGLFRHFIEDFRP